MSPPGAFDREAAFGTRLDIPAGTAVRFEPGDEKEVQLVGFGGGRNVMGLNALTDGEIDSAEVKERAIENARKGNFRGAGS